MMPLVKNKWKNETWKIVFLGLTKRHKHRTKSSASFGFQWTVWRKNNAHHYSILKTKKPDVTATICSRIVLRTFSQKAPRVSYLSTWEGDLNLWVSLFLSSPRARIESTMHDLLSSLSNFITTQWTFTTHLGRGFNPCEKIRSSKWWNEKIFWNHHLVTKILVNISTSRRETWWTWRTHFETIT